MNCIIYLRVSHTTGQDTDNQLPALEKMAAAKGYQVVSVYRENASAWKAGQQKELARLKDDIRTGKHHVDALLVYALDRLSRQGSLEVLRLIAQFKSLGVKVISHQEDFTGLPFGFDDVVYSFLGWAARYESERKSANTKIGLIEARRKGKTLGRPKGSKDKHKRKRLGYLLRHATPEQCAKYG